MSETTRVTEFGCKEFVLINGTTVKIRPFTFKEKSDYLKLLDGYKDVKAEDAATSYIKMQLDVAFFVVSRMNPEIKREIVEEFVNGTLLKEIIDLAFFDPFSTFGKTL